MEETLKGYFWSPENPELQHYGEVTLSTKQKNHQLVVYGSFPAFSKVHANINFHDDIPYLFGFTKEKKFVTLVGLRIVHASFNTQATDGTSAFRAEHWLSFRQIILGSQLFDTSTKLNTVSIGAQHLSSWSAADPIRHKGNPNPAPSLNKPLHTYQLYRTPQVVIPFKDASCTFNEHVNTQHSGEPNRLDLQQESYFQFVFKEDIALEQLYEFLGRFREWYSLLSGINLGLGPIHFQDAQLQNFIYEFDANIFSTDYSSLRPEMRIISLDRLSRSNCLDHFFQAYDQFRLPLSHLMGYLNSNRTDYLGFIQPFVSAMEIIYNKSKNNLQQVSKPVNPTLQEILHKYPLSPKHRQFLQSAKLAKPYRDLHLKDKLLSIIHHSPKLVELVEAPEAFVQKILDLRHYLVHEVDKEHTDLSLLNSSTLLGRHIVKMKIIIEYHLLLMTGIDQNIVEKKIDRTTPNSVHFR